MANGDDGEIRNLVAGLAQMADSGEIDDYVALFTDGAVWEMPANPLAGLAADRRTGRADIAAGVKERRSAGVQGPGSHTLHVITTTRVELDGDRAVARSYWQFYTNTAGPPALSGIGQYHDTLHRTPEGWKVARRTVIIG